jgi:ribosomal protein S18 acetylase RimI-like enzyme
MAVVYEWRALVGSEELEALHAEGFAHEPVEFDWVSQLQQHSLGWVSARVDDELVGFANVAWDGGSHAFILDTLVASRCRHRGIGTALVATATRQAMAAGCEWLHVDFDDDLRGFYFDACGFVPTNAGLLSLRSN